MTSEHPIRIVIVDDHPFVRAGLVAVVDDEDDMMVVGEGSNGQEGIDLAQRHKPDVLLIDIQMPVMDGIEAIRQLRAKGSTVSIIVLTTFDADDYVFQAVEAGAKSYMLKDSEPEDVLRAIRAAHRGESVMEPRVTGKLLDRFTELSRGPAPGVKLSPRELEVLTLLANGNTNKNIASELFIGESTVKTHVVHILEKLDAKDRTQAVAEAMKRRLIEL